MSNTKFIRYRRELENYLRRKYTREQIDSFEWYPDENENATYSYVFIDHEKQNCRLSLRKSNHNITFSSR
jgi:hypothetical protein